MTGEPQDLLLRLIISLALGFLIGLEREYAKRVVDKEEQFAGVRTYTIIALFGFLCAFLSPRFGDWLFIAGLLGLIAMVITTYVMTAKSGSYGITTELSGILAYIIGALVFQDEILLAVIATVVITSLLSLKVKLHSFVATLTPGEIRAFIQFVIISAVVLPFLPDEPFGPNGVWNLHEIWTMVILVTGISLVGYLLAKILGARKGTLLAGIVGGLVSSTAVTLSAARRTREQPNTSNVIAAVSIIAATAVLYPRILLETWLMNRQLAFQLALPITFITLVALGAALLIHRKNGKETAVEVPTKNPLNFGVAIQFALAYMAVLWLMDLASEHYSARGLYVASLVFGATDMDAITLSIARDADITNTLQGMTAVLLATLSNTVMKFLLVVFFGDKSLRKWVGLGFGAIFLATLLGMVAMWLL
ncbi:MAG: MgtC/SapB family protein [Flavobacteriales bacterium]|nr:MgtC/SapB family protein [Flavobacteriales bacterium]